MKKPKLRRPTMGIPGTTGSGFRPVIDPATVQPDLLRDWVWKALLRVSEEERSSIRDKIVSALKQSAFNVGQCLLLLGIPARTADELTEPEIATLIRYVRLNEPKAMGALAPVLVELLTANTEPAENSRFSGHAA